MYNGIYRVFSAQLQLVTYIYINFIHYTTAATVESYFPKETTLSSPKDSTTNNNNKKKNSKDLHARDWSF